MIHARTDPPLMWARQARPAVHCGTCNQACNQSDYCSNGVCNSNGCLTGLRDCWTNGRLRESVVPTHR